MTLPTELTGKRSAHTLKDENDWAQWTYSPICSAPMPSNRGPGKGNLEENLGTNQLFCFMKKSLCDMFKKYEYYI